MARNRTFVFFCLKLLKSNDEESLECLCRLLTTIGKDLDFEKAKPHMDQYFREIDKIFKQRRTSPRVRFKLQDVLELRENNWVPRRDDNNPKTIDQIHKEAELEIQQQNLKLAQVKADRQGQDKKQVDAGKDPQQPQDDRPKPQEGGSAAAKPKKIKKKAKKDT